MKYSAIPGPQGLYDPSFERDSCGVAAVADIKGRRSNKIVADGITALINLEHRGAAGADPAVGDGAGILFQVPEGFLRAVVEFDLPVVTGANSPDGCAFAVGTAFLPQDDGQRERAKQLIADIVADEGLELIGWRPVPTDPVGAGVGKMALDVMPVFEQLFLAGPADQGGHRPFGIALDRLVYPVRKRVENETSEEFGDGVYFPSLSSRTMVYKGMLTTGQLPDFYNDIRDRRVESAIAIVHSRFSTNTFPAWPLAHPFRFIAHNGEINTVRGNRNRMRAREALLESDLIPGDLKRVFPICPPAASDSGSFDEVLELLHLGGRSLPHAVLMMIPEAWENGRDTMDPAIRGFAEFHASLMEPWDGPACVTFTDGRLLGAVLDRNGLRPGRWWLTSDDTVVLASEAGVLPIPPEKVVERGRLQPGRMFLVDTVEGRILDDKEVKARLAAEHPYSDWVHAGLVPLGDLPAREHVVTSHDAVLRRQQVFGYSEEDLRLLVTPMAASGAEAIGSMGTDTPEAVLSARPRLLFDYFSQLFAQVTNPPLDAIREQVVTSMSSVIGPEANLLAPSPSSCRQISLPFPVIDNDDLAKLIGVNSDGNMAGFAAAVISGLYEVDGGGEALRSALERCRREADEAIADGARILVLSDRDCDAKRAPIPSLLLTSAVHQHLVRQKSRTKVALITETGDAREVHHVALLLGYGAGAVNPYLALESAEDLAVTGLLGDTTPAKAVQNTIYALGKGVLKVMSKMGISTVGSYRQAQVFAAFGIDEAVLGEYFTGTTSRTGGSDLAVIAADILERHSLAFVSNTAVREHRGLEIGGQYQWRREGEIHLFNPETVYLLQHATKTKQVSVFRRYTDTVDELSRKGGTLRGMFGLRTDVRTPIPLTEVEPVANIVKRFVTGAMSYGSISMEAHETLAKAMNKLGGRSNTGEGGEDVERLLDPERRSAIKQVASGRFGVTSAYLVNADEIQIKMAQGAKPGEGGQLPGSKVYPWIAKVRYSTPGVGLISPPPHHDIYSIEDLAQLIHDLKNANPRARISVKLVAEVGVGTIAAGVAKAHADLVLISGHDGGTGASPLTSVKHAGAPWELGLAEAHQVLVLNGLRSRIVVETDGQLKTGRDVVVAALLGAEEFGFSTAPLVSVGCIMMRVCHLNTCPVGVATQNPELRKKFTGKPENAVNFMRFVATEVRELMAELGFRTLNEMIGHTEHLEMKPAIEHWKARGLDFSKILYQPQVGPEVGRYRTLDQDHGLESSLDMTTILPLCEPAIARGEKVEASLPIRNVNRVVGTITGSEITRKYGPDGLPDDTINLKFTGSAGQSFGAFIPRGMTLTLEGDANDYVGKGLSGGRIVVYPSKQATFAAEENILIGNVALYGATAGEAFFRGVAGERFAVRNSGASAVVEGVGDHGCEYMTGGRVVIIGSSGRNFAAGMSGGVAYVLDEGGTFAKRCNKEMVGLDKLEDPEEATLVHGLVLRHAQLTGSKRAEEILATWKEWVPYFVRVMPNDYRRVIETQKKMRDQGLSQEEAEMAAFEMNAKDTARLGGK